MYFIRTLNKKRLGTVVAGGRMGVRGEFRCINRDFRGRVKHDSGWFDNLITNQGLDNMCGAVSSVWCYAIHVGSGTTPPSFTDTALDTHIAGAGFNYSSSYGDFKETYGWYDIVPWEATQNYGRIGTGPSGTIREVGLSGGTAQSYPTGSPYMSVRQLLPEPFVKQTTDVLDVYYKVYWYINTADATGTTTIDGTSYDYIARIGGLAGSNQGYNWGTCFYNPSFGRSEAGEYSDGSLPTIHQGGLPDGDQVGLTCSSYGPAPNYNEHWNGQSLYMSLDNHTDSNTVRCVHTHDWRTRLCTAVRFGRTSDDNPVPFSDKEIMTVKVRLYYDRYTPDVWMDPLAYTVTGEDGTLTHNP